MESFLCSRIIQGGKFNEKSFVSEAEILGSEAMLALLLLDAPDVGDRDSRRRFAYTWRKYEKIMILRALDGRAEGQSHYNLH